MPRNAHTTESGYGKRRPSTKLRTLRTHLPRRITAVRLRRITGVRYGKRRPPNLGTTSGWWSHDHCSGTTHVRLRQTKAFDELRHLTILRGLRTCLVMRITESGCGKTKAFDKITHFTHSPSKAHYGSPATVNEGLLRELTHMPLTFGALRSPATAKRRPSTKLRTLRSGPSNHVQARRTSGYGALRESGYGKRRPPNLGTTSGRTWSHDHCSGTTHVRLRQTKAFDELRHLTILRDLRTCLVRRITGVRLRQTKAFDKIKHFTHTPSKAHYGSPATVNEGLLRSYAHASKAHYGSPATANEGLRQNYALLRTHLPRRITAVRLRHDARPATANEGIRRTRHLTILRDLRTCLVMRITGVRLRQTKAFDKITHFYALTFQGALRQSGYGKRRPSTKLRSYAHASYGALRGVRLRQTKAFDKNYAGLYALTFQGALRQSGYGALRASGYGKRRPAELRDLRSHDLCSGITGVRLRQTKAFDELRHLTILRDLRTCLVMRITGVRLRQTKAFDKITHFTHSPSKAHYGSPATVNEGLLRELRTCLLRRTTGVRLRQTKAFDKITHFTHSPSKAHYGSPATVNEGIRRT
ncbi:unnamed protein product [Acanthosepion pharaonis]|uniref:Uncharacterized protein n=1 Tax=Acanthosepion pharaonis TaxID=158019 RepID=A0A812DT17_ACAPH|nr:unnamed protein product [Sepia pharaonis]